ncbi:hypothetical protein C0T31_04530 [Dysgonamonadaceae bacterium]|nr:hypothetical protein C0T31_04530 [Dysgonamonadaceae bacterium]
MKKIETPSFGIKRDIKKCLQFILKEVKKLEVGKLEMGIENYELPISNYECDHLHFSICDYLREPIYFFSRRSTLIFFSQIHADLFSAPICDFNLRISA